MPFSFWVERQHLLGWIPLVCYRKCSQAWPLVVKPKKLIARKCYLILSYLASKEATNTELKARASAKSAGIRLTRLTEMRRTKSE